MARQVLDNGVILPSEYSDDWYDDMTSNLTKLDEVIGSDAEKLSASEVGQAAISNDYDDLDDKPAYNILRRASVTLTAGGTGNYTDLDSDSKIKAGDYVLDAANKLYSITAIDAANSTYTVSAAALFTVTDKAELGAAALSNSYDDLSNLPGYGVLRFCSTAITDNSSVAFANISSVSKIAAGDFLLDTAAKLYQISSVDTVNETAAVTTTLTQLAVDSGVVHKSEDETISGTKTFTNNTMVVGRDTDGTSVVQFVNSDVVGDSSVSGKSGFEVYGTSVSNANKIGSVILGEYSNNSGSYALITCNRTVSGVKSSNEIRNLIRSDGSKELTATVDNDCKLGSAFLRWSKIYGTEYYYGSNNVEFSTKFVTTDTAQTISGNKTFSSNVNVYNSDSATDTANIVLKNSKAERGSTTNIGEQTISFLDKDNAQISQIKSEVDSSGVSTLTLQCTNSSNSSSGIRLRRTSTGTFLQPVFNNGCNLGTNGYRWYDTQTRAINGVEPSSLGMPIDRGSRIDISGSFTDTSNGGVNRYTAPSNGFVYLAVTDVVTIHLFSQDLSRITNYGDTKGRASAGQLYAFLPVRKNDVFTSQWYTTATNVTVTSAYFIPCQGNV